jgi:hypothetical protein
MFKEQFLLAHLGSVEKVALSPPAAAIEQNSEVCETSSRLGASYSAAMLSTAVLVIVNVTEHSVGFRL